MIQANRALNSVDWLWHTSVLVGCASLYSGLYWPMSLVAYFHATRNSFARVFYCAWVSTAFFRSDTVVLSAELALLAIFFLREMRFAKRAKRITQSRFFLSSEDFFRQPPPQWRMPFLRHVSIFQTNERLINIGVLPWIETLHIHTIGRISNIARLTCLKELDLQGDCNIDELSNLPLRRLNLLGAHLDTMPSLSEQLTDLTLEYCGLASVAGIEMLTQLNHLSLSSNRLRRVDQLSLLRNLKSLNLRNNTINELPHLCSKIEWLEVSFNRLYALDCTALPNLKELFASSNRLRRQPSFTPDSLVYLDLSLNPIRSINLVHMSKLKTLYCCQEPSVDDGLIVHSLPSGLKLFAATCCIFTAGVFRVPLFQLQLRYTKATFEVAAGVKCLA